MLIIILAGSYAAYAVLRPLPAPKTVITPPVMPALVKVGIPWPRSSPKVQAAYGADGYGVLATSQAVQTPMPTASITKVITAMAVLKKHPLKPGEQGPSIPITANDAALTDKYLALDGAVIPVSPGESITQYQALEAILLSSANNLSDTLAIWAFGNLAAYSAYANTYVNELGMNSTAVTDASGFAPTTVSTPADLVKLGDAMLDNPVLTEIVSKPSYDFPGSGTLQNGNPLLGQSGIRGIKTGMTDEAGGCFLAAADVAVGADKVRVITAVMGSPDVAGALRDTLPLIQSTQSQFQNVQVVRAGQTVGQIHTGWGASSPIIANGPIDVTTWVGLTIPALTSETEIKIPASAKADIGMLNLNYLGRQESTRLRIANQLPAPDLRWRLTHPF